MSVLQGSSPKNGVLIFECNKTKLLTFHFHIFIYSTCNHFTHSGSSNGCQGKMLKQNAVRSNNAKLKCRKFSTHQKREINMQRKISDLQYTSDLSAVSDADDTVYRTKHV